MNKAAQFLLISYAWAFTAAALIRFLGVEYGSFTSLLIIALLYMPSPAYATLMLEQFNFKKIAADYGISFQQINWKKLLLYLIGVVVLIPVLLLVLTYILGNLLSIEGVGTVVNSNEEIRAFLALEMGAEVAEKANLPNMHPLFLLPISMAAAIGAGFTINGLLGFGEELGWRGLLFKEWEYLGWFRLNVYTGIVWGLWHAPLILLGHNYPENPYLGILMMVFLSIAMSFIMADMRVKSKSVIGPAVLHGAFNGLVKTLVILTIYTNALIGGITGVVGIVAMGLTYLVLRKLVPMEKPMIDGKIV